MPEPVDRIVVRQDVGGPYPVYKKIVLLLWEDGTVTWERPDPPADSSEHYY